MPFDEERWENALNALSPEDKEHLEKEAEGASPEEKADMLQQVEQILAEDAESPPEEAEVERRWDEAMELLNEEDRDHLLQEAQGASVEERWEMLQQVEDILSQEEDGDEQEAGGSNGNGQPIDIPSEEELKEQWEQVMEMLGPEDREHLEKEAEGASPEEKMNMIKQVGATPPSRWR
jgi:hypothetical protein